MILLRPGYYGWRYMMSPKDVWGGSLQLIRQLRSVGRHNPLLLPHPHPLRPTATNRSMDAGRGDRGNGGVCRHGGAWVFAIAGVYCLGPGG